MSDTEPRPPGCVCTWEFGDSECPVHPTCPECGLPTAPVNQCECARPERLTVDEFCERAKEMLTDPARCKCPKCSATNLHASHGLAGGGIGPYIVCLACGVIVLKGFEDGGEGECFHA